MSVFDALEYDDHRTLHGADAMAFINDLKLAFEIPQ